jgi:hypothetical protein
MGRKWGTHGCKSGEKGSLERHKRREDNIKIDLREIGWQFADWI